MADTAEKLQQASISNLRALSKDLERTLKRFEKVYGVKLNGHLRVGEQFMWIQHTAEQKDVPYLAAFLQQMMSTVQRPTEQAVQDALDGTDSGAHVGDSPGH